MFCKITTKLLIIKMQKNGGFRMESAFYIGVVLLIGVKVYTLEANCSKAL